MRLRPLGHTGTYVTELCLGTMTFADGADKDMTATILDRYLDAGGNFIDTANVYADTNSEAWLGELLGSRREDVVLATKAFSVDRLGASPNDRGSSRRNLIRSVDASLRRLRTDRIDLLQLHCWDNYTPLEETLSALDDLVRAGKVIYLGASNFAGWQIAKSVTMQLLNGWQRFVTIQPQYSLLVRDAELEILPASRDAALGVLAWSPLAGGILTGKYRRDQTPTDGRLSDPASFESQRMAADGDRAWELLDTLERVAAETGHSPGQVALNWLLTRPGMTAPITGARTVDQLENNLGATGWDLDPALVEELDNASRRPHDYVSEFIAGANSAPDKRGQGADD
jgi:aryl-alcohol dehydrogenase-like predicted oxidoreductase